MPSKLHPSSQCALIIAFSFCCIAATNAQFQPAGWIELVRSSKVLTSHSPHGNYSVDVLPPKDENADPQIVAEARNARVPLGPLRRSARVFWRPDGQLAVLWDLAYSNHFFVWLIRMEPQPKEIRRADELVKQAVNHDFHTSGIAHYWPYAEGWLDDNQLLVVVCADGPPAGSKTDALLKAFRRGYVIDTRTINITRSMDESEYSRLLGKAPCQ